MSEPFSHFTHVLEQLQLCVLSVTDKGAALHGGDVLFTVQEFFVGISPWTNLQGAEAVADDFTVSMVPVGHLKGFLSMADPQTIAHSCSHGAHRALRVGRDLGGENHNLGRGLKWRGNLSLGRGEGRETPPKGAPKNSMKPQKTSVRPLKGSQNLVRAQNPSGTPEQPPKNLVRHQKLG
uniref:Uncharacterized protein n=1 Tax=Catharus ustulatus TaxID=91951 RepID=A0A8C3UPZ6_CATUS